MQNLSLVTGIANAPRTQKQPYFSWSGFCSSTVLFCFTFVAWGVIVTVYCKCCCSFLSRQTIRILLIWHLTMVLTMVSVCLMPCAVAAWSLAQEVNFIHVAVLVEIHWMGLCHFLSHWQQVWMWTTFSFGFKERKSEPFFGHLYLIHQLFAQPWASHPVARLYMLHSISPLCFEPTGVWVSSQYKESMHASPYTKWPTKM